MYPRLYIQNLFVVFLVLLASTSKAQILDGHIDFIKNAMNEKPKLIGGFHNRYTFVRSQKIVQRGLMLGLDYSGIIKLYTGYYGFSRVNNTRLVNDPDWPLNPVVIRKMGLGYMAIGADYTFAKVNKWYFSAPLELGYGRVRYIYTDEDDKKLADDKFFGIPVSVGGTAAYEILPVASVKGGAGYRLFFGKKPFRQLSAPYFTIGFSLKIGQIAKQFLQK